MADNYSAKEAFARFDEWYRKLNEATIASGHLVVRSTLLLNGGACIALLGFLATVYGSGNSPEGGAELIANVVDALPYFGGGALASVVTGALAFVANRTYLEAAFSREKVWSHPYIQETKKSKFWRKVGNGAMFLSLVAGAASLVLFLYALNMISEFY